MGTIEKGITERREATDVSLDAEREATDLVLEKAESAVQSLADDVLEIDRRLTDEEISTVRVHADVTIAEAGVGTGWNRTIAIERQAHARERAATDAILDEERARTDEALEMVRELRANEEAVAERRDETDERLHDERRNVDRAVALLGERESALSEKTAELEARSATLAMVAHDLRNPLSVIALSADFILQHSTAEAVRERASDARNAASLMKRLVGDLLDVVSVETQSFRISRVEGDVAAVLDEVYLAHLPLFEAKSLALRLELRERPMTAWFDRDRVVQALSNLLANAMKFTPSGGVVTLAASYRLDAVDVSVRDTGPGLSVEKSARVFERFWKADASDARGLGLGLYIARNIVEAHGGQIAVDTRPGAGALFRFTLPKRA